MELSQYQTQTQQQVQTQTLSPQQLLRVKLLELPIEELEERVKIEINDNPALDADTSRNDEIGIGEPADNNMSFEEQERRDTLEDTLKNMGADDEMPPPNIPKYHSDTIRNFEYGNAESFQDSLTEQIGELRLTEKQQQLMQYLVGSLDDDGYLRKELDTIADELIIYQNLDTTEEELEEVLVMLQTLDPAGIGARNLQECLLLQIERQSSSGKLRNQFTNNKMADIVKNHFDDFILKHFRKIQKDMGLTDMQASEVFRELQRLNPKPGSSMNETSASGMQQITPDFIVENHENGKLSFYVNHGDLPELKISDSFEDVLNMNPNSRDAREAIVYAKDKISNANNFIDAMNQRYHTMYVTMKAIIEIQRAFFRDGDESSMKPMILKDIAQKTNLDISTVSRACNSKYVQTRWGIFPLKSLFNDAYVTSDGTELSTKEIKQALKDLIDNEDKKKPLSDDALGKKLGEMGYPIARRTVAKYREQLNYAVARLRKVEI